MGAGSGILWWLAAGASAGPVVTDTVPGPTFNNTQDWAYKLDIISVERTSRLVTMAPWLRFDRGGQGDDELHLAVYAEDAPGSNDWDVVFDSGLVGPVGARGDFFPVDVDLVLEAGRRYAIGFVLEEGNFEYAYDSGPGVTPFGWGRHVGAIYVGENQISVFPTRIDDAPPQDVGYWQELTIEILDVDGDGVTEDLDCDDRDPRNFPGSPEWCDGRDNDCTGAADDPIDYVDSWPDDDGDGYGDDAGLVSRCEPRPPPGHVGVPGDCDDGDADVHPGVPEYCDQRDEDCSGVADDDPVTTGAFEDLDADGFGGAPTTYCTRELPPDLLATDGDCDDEDPLVFPGAPEVCDGLDQDCDAVADDGLPRVFVWVDADLDGAGDPDTRIEWCPVPPPGYVTDGTDCDDADPRRTPGNEEICDGVDDDCDGLAPGEGDLDGDEFLDCLDCAPDDPTVHPGAPEPCDGVDHDCDGVIPTRLECDPAPTEALAVEGCGCAVGAAPTWSFLLGFVTVAAAGRRRRC
jgi:hypothetical protein